MRQKGLEQCHWTTLCIPHHVRTLRSSGSLFHTLPRAATLSPFNLYSGWIAHNPTTMTIGVVPPSRWPMNIVRCLLLLTCFDFSKFADLEDVLRDVLLPLVHVAIYYFLIWLTKKQINGAALDMRLLQSWKEHYHTSCEWITVAYVFGYFYGIFSSNGIRGAALRNIDLFLLIWIPQAVLPYLPGYPDFISSYEIVHELFGISFATQVFAALLLLFLVYTIHNFFLAGCELAKRLFRCWLTNQAKEITFNHLVKYFEERIAQNRYQAVHWRYPSDILLTAQKLSRQELPWLKTYGHPARPDEPSCPYCKQDFSRDSKTYTCPGFGCHRSWHRVCVYTWMDGSVFDICPFCKAKLGLAQRGSIWCIWQERKWAFLFHFIT